MTVVKEVVEATLRVSAAFGALSLAVAVLAEWPEIIAALGFVALACSLSVPIVAGVIALRDRSGR